MLHTAVKNGSVPIVELRINAGCDVNAQDVVEVVNVVDLWEHSITLCEELWIQQCLRFAVSLRSERKHCQ